MTEQRYPRINCCIKGCARGTTTVEPGTRIICRKCWNRAPKALRDKASRWQRRARRFDRKGDYERADLCARRSQMVFEQVRSLLNGLAPDDGTIPPLMAEELRKAGLL